MAPFSGLSGFELSRRDRLVVYYVVGLVVLVSAYAVLYNLVMARLEGVDQSIFASFEFVFQTMTTTGYGQDAGLWSHPLTFVFVALVQLSGIGIGFFTLRLVIIPLFTDAEVNLDDRLTPKSDHVIVCEYGRDSTVLLDELRELGVEYVLLSSVREDAKALSDRGYSAIHGSPQEAEAFERASLDAARAVVTDAGDANVDTILTVRSIRPDVEVIALTDDGELREVLLDTGADSVLSPRAVLGRRLAEKAVASFGPDPADAIELGADIEVTELPVPPGSPLVGKRLRDSNIRERTGATVIAAWIDGELQLPPDPDAVIRPNTVLVASGGHDALTAFGDYTRPARSLREYDRVVVAGFGEVGQAARSVLVEADLAVTTIDREDREGVDVVGDAASKATLREAGIESAGAVVVGLSDDSTTLLTTVLARSLNPEVEILVWVSDVDATRKALSAGADYVLSLPRISARMVTAQLRGEPAVAPASQVRFARVPATPFAGSTLADLDVYGRTGCRVIAVEDEAGISDTVDPHREFDGDERVVVVGSDEAVQRFLGRYGVSPVATSG